MKKFGSMMLAATGALAVAAGMGTAQAGTPEGSWFVAPQVNALWLDDDRVADDDAGVTLSFGKSMSPNWDAQISMFGSEHDRAGGDLLELQGVGLSLNRVFYRDSRVSPFLTFGLAKLNSILKPGVDDSNMSALFGAGITIDLGQPRNDGSVF